VTLQFLVDGLMAGALIGLGAIGVTLTYSILGFANFAHGEFITFGAYATLLIASAIGALVAGSDQSIGPLSITWAMIAASVAAMGLTGALALALDFALFRRLRGKSAAISLVWRVLAPRWPSAHRLSSHSPRAQPISPATCRLQRQSASASGLRPIRLLC